MNITINGLQLGESTDYNIEAPVEGLDMPPIRTSSQNYSGRDGGSVNGQFYSPRLITIPGFLIGGTCDDHDTLRQTLSNSLPIREDLEVIITTFSGDIYETIARVIDFKMPITGPKSSRYKIDLLAPDPFFNNGDLQSLVIPRSLGGGFILPVIFPIVFDAGSSPVTAANASPVEVSPTITIVGSATNPEITNVDTGEKIEFTLTMGVSDTLIIDMGQRTATLNGGSVLGYKTSDSTWFTLAPGNNRFAYFTDNGSDTGVCTMTWNNVVASI